MDLARLEVFADGTTIYSISGEERLSFIRHYDVGGRSICAISSISPGTVIVENRPLAVCVVSEESTARVCHTCLYVIKKHVKRRDDCSYISCCSHACLQRQYKFIDTYGVIVNEIMHGKKKSAYADSMLLVLHLLYSAASMSASERCRRGYNSLWKIHCIHSSNSNSINEHLNVAADWLYALLASANVTKGALLTLGIRGREDMQKLFWYYNL